MYVSEILLKVLMWDNMLKVYTKEEAIAVLKGIMEKHNVDRLLVVHGKNSYKACGGDELIGRLFEMHNMQIANFSEFTSDPKMEDVIKGYNVVQAVMPNAIVALGGGSAIDMAKLIRRNLLPKRIPMIAIPTTAGTGSEVTQFAVCYKNDIKESVDYPDMIPEYSLLIPELTQENNQYLTACTGFDAFAQAVESLWNIHSNTTSEQYAKEAIVVLANALGRFAENAEVCMKDTEWRAQMMEGAHLAGKAINITRTTAPHAMSYVLTSKYRYPHGHAVALTFPYFANLNINCEQALYMGANYGHYAEKMQWLRECLCVGNQNIFNYMKRFLCRMGLSYDKLRPIDVDVVAQSVNMQRAGNNPHMLNEAILRDAARCIKVDM